MMTRATLRRTVAAAMVACTVAACQQIPPEALELSQENLQQRNMQTRRFDTADEASLLSAAAATLQDFGFTLAESETRLGVLVGTKERDAYDAGQIAGAVVLALLTGTMMDVDKNQRMRASVVTRPASDGRGTLARVTFQRIVRNTHDRVTTLEGIADPTVYRQFFAKLSKSVFLEANEL